MLPHTPLEQLPVEEVGQEVVTYEPEPPMVRRPRISHRRMLTFGLAGAASLLLSSCDSTTASEPRGRTNPSAAQPLAEAGAAEQAVVVVGTGVPAIDVPAVQAAVDQGGDVILKGHFSFRGPPTVVVPISGYPSATVLVTKAVAITGEREEADDGEMTTIDGGSIPFFVSAPAARVSIQRLRFVRPVSDAVLVYAVSGLDIASCRIEGLEPFQHFGEGIGVNTSGNSPNPTQPGHPENVSGTLRVAGNHIDVDGGTVGDNTLGVVVFSVGTPGAPVQLHVSGNTIMNSTERAINIYQVDGQARIERNAITTSTLVGSAASGIAPDVIHITGSGSYLVARNLVHSRWAQGGGIRVHSQFPVWPIANAVVEHNDVYMDAPAGTVFGTNSAGIDIWGNANDNVVRHNRIRGRARAALAVNVFRGGVPANDAFIDNRFRGFEASLADVFVGPGASGTRIVGRGTVVDQGTGTIISRRDP